MRSRHRMIVGATLMAVTTMLVTTGAAGATGTAGTAGNNGTNRATGTTGTSPQPPPWLVVDETGATQPVFSLADAIEESVYVESTVDSDLDGKRDRVHLRLSRPRETQTQGLEVSVIFEHSPYRTGVGGGVNHNVDFDVMPQEYLQPKRLGDDPGIAVSKPDLPGGLDNYWVPRGYAVVLGESIGTGASDGCPTSGDSAETLGTKAIIDWLNGRAKAWNEAGEPVTADWSTGDVGMIGTSYNGTLPNMVATTGVEGLKTIVPVSAISSWYDYYRANGLVVAPHSQQSGRDENGYLGEDLDVLADFVGGPSRVEKCRHITDRMTQSQDRITGDYSPYWRARDYLPKVDRVKASVFVVHGLEDYNVKTKAFAAWWKGLARNQVPRKIWLHKDGHGGPRGVTDYQVTVNRWFAHCLYHVDNHIMSEPRANIQSPDGAYHKYADWPVPGTRSAVAGLTSSNSTDPGSLVSCRNSSFCTAFGPAQSFVDKGRELDTDVDLIAGPDIANPNRLVYLSPELNNDVHLSGTPMVSLRASVDNRFAANLTAVLVDYDKVGSTTAPVTVTRGWMDVQNRELDDKSRPIVKGKKYTFTWDLQADDYVFPKGHRIGLVVVSTDHDYTIRPSPGTRLTVLPGKSAITLPVVGGQAGLGF